MFREKLKNEAKSILKTKNGIKIIVMCFLASLIFRLPNLITNLCQKSNDVSNNEFMTYVRAFLNFLGNITYGEKLKFESCKGIKLGYCFLGFLCFLIASVLLVEITRLCYKIINKKEEKSSIGDMFYYFKDIKLFGRALWINVNVLLRMLTYVIIAVAIIIALLWKSAFYVPLHNRLLMQTVIQLVIAICFWFSYIFMKYAFAEYIFVSEKKEKVNDCISESIKTSKCRRWQLLKLMVSFYSFIIVSFLFNAINIRFLYQDDCVVCYNIIKYILKSLLMAFFVAYFRLTMTIYCNNKIQLEE